MIMMLLLLKRPTEGEKRGGKKRRERTYRPLWNCLNLGPHVFFQFIGALGIGRGLIVVFAAIVEDQLRVTDEVFRGRIEVFFVFFFHSAEVHRFFNDFVVIGDLVAVDWLRKGPGGGVVLYVIEKMQELVVVGSMAWLAGQFVHVRGPAGSFDGRDRHWVNFVRPVSPLFWRRVHDVRLAKCAHLSCHRLFLLEEHPAGFEITNPGDHGALHDGSTFVVFNVSHPS